MEVLKYKLMGLKSNKIMQDELQETRHKNKPYLK